MKSQSIPLRELDPSDIYSRIYNFPQQLQDGYNLPIVGGVTTIDRRQVKNIIVAGMGGSAIGGDLLRAYLADQIDVPVIINRNYRLPKFVDRNSLIVASSYSGNTEESLAAYEQAVQLGCSIFVVTTGGRLGEGAKRENRPGVILPKGYEPRAALGYSFGPLLHFFVTLGLIPDQSQSVSTAVSFLTEKSRTLADEMPEKDNRARQIAAKLRDRVAIVYAGADFYDAAAVRFKGQICENAKQLAFANISPEFNHNELVGFEFPAPLASKVVVIFLTGVGDHPRVKLRFDIIGAILKEKRIETISLSAEGPNRLAEIFSLVQLGDFVSYYLALLNKIDPSPVKVIDRLKAELERVR